MIELRAGALRCELHPALGGAIAGLWLEGRPVLRSTPAAQLASARDAALLPLVPFSNRIGHAEVVWQGTQQPLVRHGGDAPHAILGLASQRPWTLLDQEEDGAMLAFEHRPDSAWPFAFDCSHTLRLRPTGLELTLALTNQASQAAPAGLGWRALFERRPGRRVALQADGRWEFGADRLPLQRRPAAPLAADSATLAADECRDGWTGLAQVDDERLHVRIRSELTRVLVCGEAGRDAFALAPVSHVPNAVHLYAAGASTDGLGLTLLAPGETLLAQMTIAAEAA